MDLDAQIRARHVQGVAILLREAVLRAKKLSEEDFVESEWCQLSSLLHLNGQRLGRFFYKVFAAWKPEGDEISGLSKKICVANDYFDAPDYDGKGVLIEHLIEQGVLGTTREELMAESTYSENFKLMEFICEKCGKIPFIMMPDDNFCDSGEGHSFVVKSPGSMVQYVVGQSFSPEMMEEQAKCI
jgi:hypothetical protein